MKDQHRLLTQDFFASISKNDLKELGVGNVAYVKRYVVRGHEAFVLHAADGAALAVQSSESIARQNAYYQDLELATVH